MHVLCKQLHSYALPSLYTSSSSSGRQRKKMKLLPVRLLLLFLLLLLLGFNSENVQLNRIKTSKRLKPSVGLFFSSSLHCFFFAPFCVVILLSLVSCAVKSTFFCLSLSLSLPSAVLCSFVILVPY